MRQRGFTLIELLVAISVLAIVAVLGWRGLDSILRSRVALTQEMEQTRGIQLAFAQLQNDLEQLAPSEVIGATRQNLVADNLRLIFVRTHAPDLGPTQLVVVSYRLRDGVLTRRESAATRDLVQLDALWQVALSDGDPVPGVGLHAGVAGMGVRLWTNGGWTQPQNGGTSAGTSSSGAPAPGGTSGTTGPTGLEMSLQLINEPNPLVKVLLLGAT
ncbi:PulJ/GspJ family protein [Pseudoduganella albidiflava]|uniref:General secretion pathway protein GspJ n=1 Tax=Pseudoduganella albidiflava TaxID=321983 RepID=A0A411X5D5_9BURK|nr:prepilin-type N-terminal cleavage/methylation domain-containing protein [Pseudoduganella albidiflava]QBI04114.1 prepilin-type N-terminal cleavage/methylation domain-containing protein [Pseudoduganella albidiflava]GGY24799.1 general secretion pathway protein GspJ [Pseudoduganella albidiflava]